MTWMLRRPLLALVILIGLLLAPGPLMLKVNLNNAPEVYFPEDAPAVVFDDALRAQFPQDQVLVALFEGPDLFSPAFLERMHALVRALEADSRIERVLAATTTDHIRATEDGFAVERLIDPDALTEREPAAWRERVLGDTFAPGLLVARDGEAMALVVRPHPMEDSLRRLELERVLRQGIEAHGLSPSLAAVAGHVALDVAQLRAMITDLATLVPGTMGIGLFLLWWLFRRMLVVTLAAAAIATVTGLAMGLLIALGKPFTLITAIVPPLLTALTVAILMHLFNAIVHAAQRGLRGEARLRAALEAVARPVWFTALTTAAGLASLMVSPIRPIESFGLVAAVGVLCAAAVCLLLLPALILRWDRGHWGGRRNGLRHLDHFTAWAARLAVRRAGVVVGVAALLLVIAVPQIARVEVETDLYAFFGERHEITQATRMVESRLSGVMALEVVFDGPDFDSLMAPERLRAIEAVQAWLDQRPEVDYSLSLPQLVAEMHWAFNEEDPAFRTVPQSPDLVAQYLFIYDGRDLFDLVDRDFTRTRLLLNLNAHGARALNALMDDLRAHLSAHPPADLTWDFAGMGRLFADQERLLITGQVNSLIAVVVMVTILMLWMWRSVSVAAISMVPNFAPIVFIFALMGVLGVWLDMATAMIASVAVGIALDDTIHILHGYRSRRRAGASVAWAVARTFRHSGRAVTATTIVLCAQFVLMALSAFQPTNAFGLLTAFGLIVALVFDLLVLPAILVLVERSRKGTRQQRALPA